MSRVWKRIRYCFVATACYNDPQAQEVLVLRKFRDRHLMNDYRGRQFIAVYYIVGPKMAAIIDRNEGLKRLSRQCLNPVVKCVKFLTGGIR